jgi:putative flippase GtrA
VNALIRWGKFNLVGAIGMAVQLTALAVLSRWMGSHYLLATGVAIELTLLHNFAWHWCYTWWDRRGGSTLTARLLRFHLSNGVISLAGNLLLMRLFVRYWHMPMLVSNGISILICSIVNFWIGNDWAFAAAA